MNITAEKGQDSKAASRSSEDVISFDTEIDSIC